MVESQPTWLSAEDEGGPQQTYTTNFTLFALKLWWSRGPTSCRNSHQVFSKKQPPTTILEDIGPYTEATLPAAVGSRQNERLLEAVIFEFVSRQTCRVRRGGLRYLRKISEECGLAGSSSYGRGCKQFCRPGRRS